MNTHFSKQKKLSQPMSKCIVVIIALLCMPLLGVSQEATKLKPRINASVFKKLHKGVNMDTATPFQGVWPKVQHDVKLFEAVADAGFESVRIFSKGKYNDQQIVDAFANDLAIVICLWGSRQWSKDQNLAEKQLAGRWREMAEKYKGYSNNLVFEILNEPKGIGFEPNHENNANVMAMYNAAIQAIRDVDSDRPILVGMPGYNDSEFLDPYVTDKFLTYTFGDGKGFYDDPNIGVSIHFYNPKYKDGINFAMGTNPLGDDAAKWKAPITEQIMYAVDWRNKINIDIPIITTEWGCWLFPERSNEDLNKWFGYHMRLFKQHNIGNMWYTGIQNNQRTFGLFDSEFGWNQLALDKLTGVIPTILPKTNQVVNGEFFKPDFAWKLTSDKISKEYIYGKNAFSGSSMLKLTVSDNIYGQLYLQTYKSKKGYKGVSGRSLLHLVKGETYRISFIAASEKGNGRMKVLLKDAKTMKSIYDSYEENDTWITIDKNPKTYTKLYTHNAETVMDVRLEFDLGAKQQVLYLDKVEFIRN